VLLLLLLLQLQLGLLRLALLLLLLLLILGEHQQRGRVQQQQRLAPEFLQQPYSPLRLPLLLLPLSLLPPLPLLCPPQLLLAAPGCCAHCRCQPGCCKQTQAQGAHAAAAAAAGRRPCWLHQVLSWMLAAWQQWSCRHCCHRGRQPPPLLPVLLPQKSQTRSTPSQWALRRRLLALPQLLALLLLLLLQLLRTLLLLPLLLPLAAAGWKK
jgi:hypothetical protein